MPAILRTTILKMIGYNFYTQLLCQMYIHEFIREMGVAHRITFSFNYFFFTCCFIYSIYCWYKI